MPQRPLGRTGLAVSVLSLGGAAIGQQYGPVTQSEVNETVSTALDAGVNLIDTSAYYGQGVSETMLGQALANGLRQRVHICTKAGRFASNVFDFSPAAMRRSLDESLKRLRTDHVEILLAHDIEFADDYERIFTETANVLHELKREGKCRFVGMSCYPLGLLKQAIERCQLDVVISYCHFNLQNQRLLAELLPTAEKHGVGVLNASPLAMGLLTNQGPPPWHPADEEINAACRQAAALCREQGHDIAELGMQFCVAERTIPSTITGTARAAELRINLEAMKRPFDPRMLATVEEVLSPVRDRTWPSGNWKG